MPATITCPNCRSTNLTLLSTYIDRYTEEAVADPPERVQRVFKCACGHGFMDIQSMHFHASSLAPS